MFGAVRAPRVYEHIVAQIERAIYEGRFAHGDKLPPERQLVREFGASRVAVREALRALEHRGLVEVRQGSAGGYFIRELDATPVVRDLSTLFRLGRVSLAHLAEAEQRREVAHDGRGVQLADEVAAGGALSHLDEAAVLESAERLPHGHAAGAEFAHELALGRELVAVGEPSVVDRALDLRDDVLVDARRSEEHTS